MRWRPRGSSWIAVLGVLIATTAAAEERSAKELAANRKLYVTKCARCHKLYEPSAYTSAEWDMWMTKMRRKVKLKDAQYAQLLRYLQSLSQDGALP